MENKIKLEVEIEESKAKELLNAIFGASDFEFELKNLLSNFGVACANLGAYERNSESNFSYIHSALVKKMDDAEQAIIDHVMTEIRKLGGK